MYHGLEFSRRTFGVLFGLFLLAFLIDCVSEKAHRDFTEGSALEQEVWRLRSENMRAERELGAVQAQKAEAERQNEILEARLKRRLTPADVRLLSELAIQAAGLKWGESEITAMVQIAWKESRFYTLDQNPVSTAFGTWQFLDATWRGTKIHKTTDPLLQTIAFVRYTTARYKTPTRALAFHDRRNYY